MRNPCLSNKILAAPSWVMPGTALENARFLAGFPENVQEIALCLFDTDDCLSQDLHKLRTELAALPLRRHLHLPMDLPWHTPDKAIQAALDLMEALAPNESVPAVLHPPLGPFAGRLEPFIRAWRSSGRQNPDLLLENIDGADLPALLPLIQAHDLSVCLDVGHALAFNQTNLLDFPALLQRVRLLHLHAPGHNPDRVDGHRPLTELTPEQRRFMRAALAGAPPEAAILLEIFNWRGYLESLPVLERLLG